MTVFVCSVHINAAISFMQDGLVSKFHSKMSLVPTRTSHMAFLFIWFQLICRSQLVVAGKWRGVCYRLMRFVF